MNSSLKVRKMEGINMLNQVREMLAGRYLAAKKALLKENSRNKADYACREHLPRRPRALTKVNIRHQHRYRAYHKSRLRAERNA